MAKVNARVRDYGTPAEYSSVQFPGVPLSAANFDAENTLITAIMAALADMTIGTVVSRSIVAAENNYPDTQPASPFAQRESKWLVRYSNSNTGEKATMTIPCADLSLLDPNGNDKADMTDAAVIAFVDAFEAYVPAPGAADRTYTHVDEIVFVGRRL